MCEILVPLAHRLFLVPVHSQRSTAPEAMQAVCQKINPAAEVAVCASLVEALKRASEDPFVVIAGSLYLVGEAMEVLQHKLIQPGGERGLNEWQSAARKQP
jgi:folylpolyglutamate synthase/dihydropteroate synthase